LLVCARVRVACVAETMQAQKDQDRDGEKIKFVRAT
jgi:hypothetical protein